MCPPDIIVRDPLPNLVQIDVDDHLQSFFLSLEVLSAAKHKDVVCMGSSLVDQYPITLVHIMGFKIIKN